MNEEKSNLDSDVILAYLKLSRAMRRCPPERKYLPFPPAVGRLLECAAANPGVSSRELCEALDLRPSSLSEILTRAGNEGLLSRTVDENDRRVQRVFLTDKGSKFVSEMEEKLALELPEGLMPDYPGLHHSGPRHPGENCPGPGGLGSAGEDRPGPEGPGRPPFPPGRRFRC